MNGEYRVKQQKEKEEVYGERGGEKKKIENKRGQAKELGEKGEVGNSSGKGGFQSSAT